jgi:hypothetical protein
MNMILSVEYKTILGAHMVVSGGVVGIVTCYGLDGLGVRFTTLIQTGPGVHPASCEMCTGSLPRSKPVRSWHSPLTLLSIVALVELYFTSLFTLKGMLWGDLSLGALVHDWT